MKRILGVLLFLVAISPPNAKAATVTVKPDLPWLGFMNVFELPSNGGAFVFNGGWGTADLVATFSGDVLTLAPNTIGDPNPFWYVGGGGPGAPGNKNMFASMYVEDDSLVGQTVTFKGQVLSNTFTNAHTTTAFIKDFAPGYGSFVAETVLLDSEGHFSITLPTINAFGRHVQFGFETVGVNVWITDVAPFGNIQITGVPEPASLAMGMAGLLGLIGLRGRRS